VFFFAIVQGFLVKPAIKRFGEKNTVVLGYCFEILALISMSVLTNGFILICLIPIASLGVIGQPALQAIISKRTSDDSQGILQGVLSSLSAISMVLTPITMTWVFSVFTQKGALIYYPGAPFLAAALLLFMALIIFLKITGSKKHNQI